MRLHRDIFTEPDADPDTLANLGPLRPLAGVWQADKGVDVNPKANGPETRDYVEHVTMQPIDAQTNGPQLFYGMRYHLHINTPEEQITFHDQTGYWLWEPATGLILQTVAIPRGQVLLAAGHAKPGDRSFSVQARRGDTKYGICSTDFLEQNFRTEHYELAVTIRDDNCWSYKQHSTLIVTGEKEPFEHHDQNTLKRVGPATPNPLMLLQHAQQAKG